MGSTLKRVVVHAWSVERLSRIQKVIGSSSLRPPLPAIVWQDCGRSWQIPLFEALPLAQARCRTFGRFRGTRRKNRSVG